MSRCEEKPLGSTWHSKVQWLKTVGPELALHWLRLESLLYTAQRRLQTNEISFLFVSFVFILRCLWLNSLISLVVKAMLRKMGLNCCGFLRTELDVRNLCHHGKFCHSGFTICSPQPNFSAVWFSTLAPHQPVLAFIWMHYPTGFHKLFYNCLK